MPKRPAMSRIDGGNPLARPNSWTKSRISFWRAVSGGRTVPFTGHMFGQRGGEVKPPPRAPGLAAVALAPAGRGRGGVLVEVLHPFLVDEQIGLPVPGE